MIPRENERSGLESGSHVEALPVVIAAVVETTGLHARVDLDARVLRRRLHGGLPFGFGSVVF